MGLLKKLFGDNTTPEDASVKWLNCADDVYRRSFKRKRDDGLIAYFTAQCVSRIMERVRLGDTTYDGIDRYMHLNWTKLESRPEGDIYEKDVTYEDVKLAHGVTVPVGDAFKEKWLVVYCDKDKNRIADVRRIG